MEGGRGRLGGGRDGRREGGTEGDGELGTEGEVDGRRVGREVVKRVAM